MTKKIKIGISRCLLGDKVRYDGQHKLDRFLRDNLGRFVDWFPFCPEVECGLTIPREAMHLQGRPDNLRLVTVRSEKDLTNKMQTWVEEKLSEFEKYDIAGFVFKKKSPSCGLFDAKLHNQDRIPYGKTSGLFAGPLSKKYPLLPVEDEGRLNDPGIRENFIERAFIYSRWRSDIKHNRKNWLLNFHRKHKLIIMAHAPSETAILGRMAADTKNYSEVLFNNYIIRLMSLLKKIATVKRNVNVLHHILGYFKNDLSSWEKKELLELIDNYYNELIPIIVPITLIKHYISKYQKDYLLEQHYLYQHPTELKLRNYI